MGRGEKYGPHRRNSKFKANSLAYKKRKRKNWRIENMKERTGGELLWNTGHCKVGKKLGFYYRYDRKLLEEFFCFLFFGLLASTLFLSRKVA